ncbi:hypothetical protein ACODT5_01090 [Streptomyces sp. 5.8]|uniref:hypothetical protein n=1 Tax=Streptomyces sp. 5.8 TaxID=3406571 RepID=UPI003BB50053
MTSRRIDDAGISARFGVLPKDAAAWIKLANFPAADADGLRDLDQVDAWVQAVRPQYWPAKAEAPLGDRASGAQAVTPREVSVPAPVLESRSEMAKRFDMSYQAVDAWTKAKERRSSQGEVVATAFPLPVAEGRWDRAAVDGWVSVNRPRVWTAYTGGEPRFVVPLPDGHPKDLLGIGEYGVIRGNALSGKPAQRRTMQAYLLRQQIAAPDRFPKDRKRPEVFEPMWFRATIYSEIRLRLSRGSSKTK